MIYVYIHSCKSELKNKLKTKNQLQKPKTTNSNFKLKFIMPKKPNISKLIPRF